MDVETRCRRSSRKLPKPFNELLLQLVGEVVLGPEEDNTPLGD